MAHAAPTRRDAWLDLGPGAAHLSAQPRFAQRAPTMTVADEIRAKLTAAYAPSALSILDESAQHRGHAGHRPGGETHFRVAITAAAFAGKSRVERQRMVYATLAELMRNQVHALALSVQAPGEAG
jgi:BolA protein